MPPAHILEGVSEDDALRRVSGLSHSIGDIVAHMDFWQRWFLHRCGGGSEALVTSASLGWPGISAGAWTNLRQQFLTGTEAAAAFEPDRLDRPLLPAIEFPPLANYTVRDALIHVAGHNSHHLGQIITLRQLMGSWPPKAGSWTW